MQSQELELAWIDSVQPTLWQIRSAFRMAARIEILLTEQEQQLGLWNDRLGRSLAGTPAWEQARAKVKDHTELKQVYADALSSISPSLELIREALAKLQLQEAQVLGEISLLEVTSLSADVQSGLITMSDPLSPVNRALDAAREEVRNKVSRYKAEAEVESLLNPS